MKIGGGLILSPFAPQQRILPFINKSGEAIPPYAAIKLKKSRAGETSSHLGYKPSKDDDPFVVFNGPFSVEPEESGFCTADYPLWALYNPEDGDPTNGESLGTRAGYWELHRGYEGFLVWGGADGEKVYVQSDVTCRDLQPGLYQNLYYPNHGIGYCCGCQRFDCATPSMPLTLDCIITVPCIGTITQTITIGALGPGSRCSGSGSTGASPTPSRYLGGFIHATAGTATQLNGCDGLISSPEIIFFDESLSVELVCLKNYADTVIVCNGDGAWYAKINWFKVVGGVTMTFSACGYIDITSCLPFYLTKTMPIACYDVADTSLCQSVGYGTLVLGNPEDLIMYTQSAECVGGSAQVEFTE